MGTISYITTRKGMIRDLTKTEENEHGKWETLRHCMRGNNLWTKQRTTDKKTGKVITYVCLYMLQNHGDGVWAYKPVDETMGPNYVNCPLSYLEGLSEPQGFAMKWRNNVKLHWYDKRKKQ